MLENYETVAERLARWLDRDFNGQPRVITHLASQPGDDICVFRAELWVDNVLVSTGWAEEIRGQGNVNKTSHLENCESSAIGRALANAGLAGSDPSKRPSREEMSKVQRGPSSPPQNLQGAASEKQIGMIKALCRSAGKPAPAGLNGFSKQQASDYITALKAGLEPVEDDGEEPF